jgi:succinate dehydrogenase / fumarate reductase cytochrome b subunit
VPKGRPTYLNLLQIRQPVPAVVSILHRISGALLFLFLGLFLWALERSLAGPDSFAAIKACLQHPLVKLIAIGLVWAYLHHLLAGLRHLALDLDLGTELPKARATSVGVLVVSLALTAAFAVALW